MKLVQIAYGEESEQVNQQQALALVAGFPEPQGHHHPGRHRAAGRRPRARAGRQPRQDQAHRPRPGDADQEVHPGRLGPGHLVERQGPRLPHLLRRAGAGRSARSPARKARPSRPAGSANTRSAPRARWFSGRPRSSRPQTSTSSSSESSTWRSNTAAHPRFCERWRDRNEPESDLRVASANELSAIAGDVSPRACCPKPPGYASDGFQSSVRPHVLPLTRSGSLSPWLRLTAWSRQPSQAWPRRR